MAGQSQIYAGVAGYVGRPDAAGAVGVFRRTGASGEWQHVLDRHECYTVAVHPTDPKTAWFIPGIKDERRIPVDGKLVVTRTRDAGQSFDILRTGLPQEHAYDITYRHALDIDTTGQRSEETGVAPRL